MNIGEWRGSICDEPINTANDPATVTTTVERLAHVGVDMAEQKKSLKDSLSRNREINLSVIGRKSGRTISNLVWFVSDADSLYLLPVQGSDTQWYKNVLKNPSIRIDAHGAVAELKAIPVSDATQIKSVVEKFRAKYGVGDVKKYYSMFDVAVLAHLPKSE